MSRVRVAVGAQIVHSVHHIRKPCRSNELLLAGDHSFRCITLLDEQRVCASSMPSDTDSAAVSFLICTDISLGGAPPGYAAAAQASVRAWSRSGSPTSRTLVSSPCSAGWSATRSQRSVSSPWPLIRRPPNQAAHRSSEWNPAVIGAPIRDHPGRGVPYAACDRGLSLATSPFKDRRPSAALTPWRQPRIAPQPNGVDGLGGGRRGSGLVRCGAGDRAGYTSRAADRRPAHSGRIGPRLWCVPGRVSIAR